MLMKFKGLKELERKLNDLSSRAKKLDGEHNVPITELLTPSFLARCSRFQSASELFEASGFKVESQEDFAAIPDDQWDKFIRENTIYSNWQEMLKAAVAAWVKKELGI